MENMRELADSAVEMAENFGYRLDYTPESIDQLEELAQMACRFHSGLPMPENALCTAAYMFGAYLGETMLRNGLADLGFGWMEDEDGEAVVGRDDEWMAPVSKVYKRITKGAYHNLADFYDVTIGMIGGWVSMDDPRLHNVREAE